ncbi:hypothetical protein Q3G72_015959 [Acer saccharum]|nr:hypothetical protein Q3G72_015959 [Acer saccharum]
MHHMSYMSDFFWRKRGSSSSSEEQETQRWRSEHCPGEETLQVVNHVTPATKEGDSITIPKTTPEVTLYQAAYIPQVYDPTPGASNHVHLSPGEVLFAMFSGSTFFGSPSKYQSLLGGSLNSRLKAYLNFSSTLSLFVQMFADLKSTEDMRANLGTQLAKSQGRIALLEEGHAALETQLAVVTTALAMTERKATSKDQAILSSLLLVSR